MAIQCGPWRQRLCSACRCYFLETLGTLLHGKRGSVELIVRVLACLAEGLGIRGTARVFEIDPSTVLQWLVDAAEQLRAFSSTSCMTCGSSRCSSMSCVRSAVRSRTARSARPRRSRAWNVRPVGVGGEGPRKPMAAGRRRGPSHAGHGPTRGPSGGASIGPDCAPLFLTDGFREDMTALLTHYGHWVQPPRRQSKGPMPTPRWMPLPGLLYAQVVKTVRRRRLVAGQHRVVFGTAGRRQSGAGSPGWAHQHGLCGADPSHHPSACRRGRAPGQHAVQGEDGLRQQWAVFHCYDNCCLPMPAYACPCRNLSPLIAAARPRSGSRGRRRWRRAHRPCLDAARGAALRVPPWPQPAGV